MKIVYRRVEAGENEPGGFPKLVKVGDGLGVPPEFVMEMRREDGRPDLILGIEVRDGVPQCRRAELRSTPDGREVLASDLRGVLLEDLLEAAVKSVSAYMSVQEFDGSVVVSLEPTWTEDAQRDVLQQVRTVRKEARRRVTDDFLREVARVYRDNVGGNPTAAVAEHTGRSHRSAALYVQQARDKGFLGAAVRGKKGEAR